MSDPDRTPTISEKEKPEKHLSRHQRRFQERITAEAKQTHELLAEKFLLFFSQADNPEGEEVIERMKQVSAQWRLYCSRRQLNVKAFMAMDEFMDGILKQYQESKDKK